MYSRLKYNYNGIKYKKDKVILAGILVDRSDCILAMMMRCVSK